MLVKALGKRMKSFVNGEYLFTRKCKWCCSLMQMRVFCNLIMSSSRVVKLCTFSAKTRIHEAPSGNHNRTYPAFRNFYPPQNSDAARHESALFESCTSCCLGNSLRNGLNMLSSHLEDCGSVAWADGLHPPIPSSRVASFSNYLTL